jgi:hypothetical protein
MNGANTMNEYEIQILLRKHFQTNCMTYNIPLWHIIWYGLLNTGHYCCMHVFEYVLFLYHFIWALFEMNIYLLVCLRTYLMYDILTQFSLKHVHKGGIKQYPFINQYAIF